MDVRTIARLLSSEVRPPNVENRAAGGTPVRQTPFDALAQGLGRSALNAVTYPGNYMQSYQPGQSVRDDPSAADWAGEMALNMVGSPALAGGLPGTVGSGVKALPMDNASRMARAQEQGFTRDAYRGEGKPIEGEAFREHHAGRYDPGFLGGDAIYSTSAPRIANDYTIFKAYREADPAPNVMPLKVKMENPHIITGEDKVRIAQMDRFERDDWLRDIYAKGHDGVVVKYGDGVEEYVAPAASYKSRFAKFDPASQAGGGLLGGLGAAAFVGAASRDDK
jgi:hypothetical protein